MGCMTARVAPLKSTSRLTGRTSPLLARRMTRSRFRVATTIYPADGSQPYKAGGKYTRVSKGSDGSNSTAGSWRVQNVNVDATGVTSTWKSVGDGLSFSTPAGVSWEAKLDGKEYPVKGTYANETVSLKQLGDRSIEATFKRDGKIVSVDKITVSGDGKKMTTSADN